MRACAWGLRTVWPQSIPAATEVARVGELAGDLRDRVDPLDALADPADLELRDAASGASRRRQPALRRRSSRSRCSGRGCRRAPRASRPRSGPASARAGRRPRRRGPACRSRTGRRRPPRTPPARGAAGRPRARPSTVTTSCPSAWAASTRHAQTSVPSRSTEHEPHSPCSHAFFEPGRPSRSRSTNSRLSPSQTSASRALAVDGQPDPHAQTALQRSLGQDTAGHGGGRPRCRGRRRSGSPRRRRARGAPRAPSSGAVTRPGTGPAEPKEARTSPRSSSTASASETTAITIALRGPTFMNVCRGPVGRMSTAVISSSGSSAFRFGPEQEVPERQRRSPRRARSTTSRFGDQERRERVPGRGGGAEVAADRAAVADLRAADGARRLRERRQPPRRAGPAIASVYVSPAPRRTSPFSRDQPRSSGHLVQIQQRLGPRRGRS